MVRQTPHNTSGISAPVASALGMHANAALSLEFPLENKFVAYGTDHLTLLKSEEIAAQLVRWLGRVDDSA